MDCFNESVMYSVDTNFHELPNIDPDDIYVADLL